MKKKYTINELGTEKQCLNYLLNKQCKENMNCPSCNKYTKFYIFEKTKRYVLDCGHSLFSKKGTIFYKSSTPLTIWFETMFMFLISKNGVSAKELERMLGITYKAAWKITNKIRNLMNEDVKLVSGIEDFWSAFKRSVKGTYIRLGEKWMQSYVDEFVFRYN